MTIKKIEDKPRSRTIEIDLTGRDGNAFVLIAYAKKFSKQLGYDEEHIERIVEEMKLTDYEGLVHTFDREFGSFVTLWR